MMHSSKHSSSGSGPAVPSGFFARLCRTLQHRWAESELQQSFPAPLLARLAEQVRRSEQRHTGQIRICIEGGLPFSYLWRSASARERAVMQFAKLRAWDTERNNGVLIYLLQAEHAIEIVADRGLTHKVPPELWAQLIQGLGIAFRQHQYEQGLTQVVAEVSALLVQHFPTSPPSVGSESAPSSFGNELPDAPILGSR